MSTTPWIVAALVLTTQLADPAPVRAQGSNSCTISVTGVNFGTYNVFTATPDDSTGSVILACGGNVRNITVTLSRGQSGTFSPRTLRKGAEPLDYNLYRNAARTIIWGDGTGSTSVYSAGNPANNFTRTIYGRIPAAQDVSAGTYTDTVTAVINW